MAGGHDPKGGYLICVHEKGVAVAIEDDVAGVHVREAVALIEEPYAHVEHDLDLFFPLFLIKRLCREDGAGDQCALAPRADMIIHGGSRKAGIPQAGKHPGFMQCSGVQDVSQLFCKSPGRIDLYVVLDLSPPYEAVDAPDGSLAHELPGMAGEH